MREETDYKKLANRCPDCGHRLEMHGQHGCEVSTSDYEGEPGNLTEVPQPCRCRRKNA